MILRDLRKQIENVINQSGLPIDAVYFVLKDILNEATLIYENTIKEEEIELQKKLEEEQNKENKESTETEDKAD